MILFSCTLFGTCVTAEKVLKELMQPIHDRLDSMQRFASDVKPSLQYNIVPITDPFGPAVTDSQLECIVVSTETVRGANSINVKRAEEVNSYSLNCMQINIFTLSYSFVYNVALKVFFLCILCTSLCSCFAVFYIVITRV